MREVLKIGAHGDRLVVQREGLTTDLGAHGHPLERLPAVARGLMEPDSLERELMEAVLGEFGGVEGMIVRVPE